MGTPKPLLDWGGEPLIQYQVRELLEAGVDDVIVVLGHRAEDVLPLVVGASPVTNEGWAEGRASSLRRGAQELTDETALVVVLNVDQPRPAAVTSRLIDEHAIRGALITLPAHEGTRGHPPVLDASLIPELLAVTEETRGLHAVIEGHEGQILQVEFHDPIVLLDLNTRDDYERAKAQMRQVSR